MKSNIIITSAGQRVALIRAFRSELKNIFPTSKLYTVDMNPELSPACYESDGFFKVPPISAGDDYINHLEDLCHKLDIGLIIPTIDTELLLFATYRKYFLERGVNIVVSELDFVKKCRDKRETNDVFMQYGIEVPQPIDKLFPTFPLFIKPYDGSLSKGIMLIENEAEYNPVYADDNKLMFMEYINPLEHDEYTVDCYFDNKGLLVSAVPRKRISIRAGEINKGITLKNEVLLTFEQKLSKLCGARGCITIQVFMHRVNKRIIGIEINPRFGGGYPLSYRAGANYPKYIIEEFFLDKGHTYSCDWEENLLMLRYDDEVLVRNYEGG